MVASTTGSSNDTKFIVLPVELPGSSSDPEGNFSVVSVLRKFHLFNKFSFQ